MSNTEETDDDPELEHLLAAAKRAHWDATEGPRYLRTGRYRPVPDPDEVITDEQRAELERRAREVPIHPDADRTWEEIEKGLKARRD